MYSIYETEVLTDILEAIRLKRLFEQQEGNLRTLIRYVGDGYTVAMIFPKMPKLALPDSWRNQKINNLFMWY